MKCTIYSTLTEESTMKMHFATKCILYFFKASILSMFLWWHQSQLSSELKTCVLQADEQNIFCDQFYLVVSFILKNFTGPVEDGTKAQV